MNDQTPAQLEATTTEAESVLVVAGPGSGKTATLVARIHNLLANGARPEELVVLTFTNAAANELARRISEIVKLEDSNGTPRGTAALRPLLGFVGTLHSFALRMLKEHGASAGYGERVAVISPTASADLLESKAKTLRCKTPIKELLALKARGRPARSSRLELPAVVVASFLDDLKAAGLVDYDVLLDAFRALLLDRSSVAVLEIENRFSHLFVDEVQDSAPIDWDIFRAFPARWKFFVGDPDQAIYSFRGGRVAEMIAFGLETSTLVVKLEENFRSREEICEAAQTLIERNSVRLEKRTRSVSGQGGRVVGWGASLTEGEEIATVARAIKNLRAESIAVLARTNAIADGFRRGLPPLGVPVAETKSTELPRDWDLARSFVSLLVDPDNDALAFFYMIARLELSGKTPKEARTTAHAVRQQAAATSRTLNEISFHLTRVTRPQSALEALAQTPISREARAIVADKFRELPPGSTVSDLALALEEVREYSTTDEEGSGVRVLTIHGAKGREFDVVFIVGFEDEVIPGRAKDPKEIEEERRLAYVAVTRARTEVYITSSGTRVSSWGEHQKRTPSRFEDELHGVDRLGTTCA